MDYNDIKNQIAAAILNDIENAIRNARLTGYAVFYVGQGFALIDMLLRLGMERRYHAKIGMYSRALSYLGSWAGGWRLPPEFRPTPYTAF